MQISRTEARGFRSLACIAAVAAANISMPAGGQSYHDPATGFEIHRARSLILVDAALLAPESPPGIWQHALDTAEWVIARMPTTSEYAIMLGDTLLEPVGAPRWLGAGNAAEAAHAMATLRAHSVPAHDAGLAEAFDAAAALDSSPERILLIVGSLPGPNPWSAGQAAQHLDSFNAAVRHLKNGVPVDVFLMPFLNDANVAPAYWVLSLRTGGTLLTIGKDWPSIANDGHGDAEHIVFVIDTSGSMRNFGWTRARQRIEDILVAQRRLRSFQLMSDGGATLLAKKGTWIDATPDQREAALSALAHLGAVPSTSTPVEGLAAALAQVRGLPNAVVYLITDDWASGPYNPNRRRPADETAWQKRAAALFDQADQERVPVNVLALPTIFEVTHGQLYTAGTLAMRGHEIAVRTGGVFVGLPHN